MLNAPHTGTFENRTKLVSLDQGTPPTSPYFAFPFRFLRMGCSDSAWGWAGKNCSLNWRDWFCV